MNNQELSISLVSLAYRDYIAARVLLNKKYALQGITLASSSIEKYLKVILALHGNTRKNMGVHMDQLGKLKTLLAECYTDVTVHLDSRFLVLLSKAYQARYYDNLSSPLMIGFVINEIICELDFTVNLLENLIILNNAKGEIIKSAYKRAFEDKKDDLYQNNYLLLNISKKDFMERPSNAFGVFIDSTNGFKEIELEGINIKSPYDGRITDISINFK